MISKYLALNKKVSIIYADTTELIKYVEKLQNLTYVSTNIMGKFYTACGIMAFSDIKEDSDSLVVQIQGEETGLLYSELKLDENNVIIKGFIEHPKLEENNDCYELNISKIIGNSGNLSVQKNNKYVQNGYKGITPLIYGNIIDDFRNYYENSTQKPAFMDIQVLNNKKMFKVEGYLITFMPDATEDDIKLIRQLIKEINFKSVLESNNNIETILNNKIGLSNIIKLQDDLDIKYFCDCSKEKYRNMLYSLKKSDLESLIEENNINIVCDYCNKSYDFTREELNEILNNLK